MSGNERADVPETAHQAAFEDAAAEVVSQVGVSWSTMMGLRCLRLHGTFFAAQDRRTGDLLVKLDRGEVDRMIETGQGHPFAPAGRRFREWVAVPPVRCDAWSALLAAAFEHAAARHDPA